MSSDRTRPAVVWLGVSFSVLLYALAGVSALALASELFAAELILGRSWQRPPATADELVKRGYYPPSVRVDPYYELEELYPHPVYSLFWRMSGDRVATHASAVVTLDHHGFRGPWSAQRPLAFMVGGSAAFGSRASSDATTITGWLNRTQSRLQFVNAGVPDFSSFDEAARLLHQIVHFRPKLVVSYTLFNDLQQAIEQVSSGREMELPYFLAWLLPKTNRVLQSASEQLTRPSPGAVTQADLERAVDAAIDDFVDNQERMHALSLQEGFRFVTVIQPMTQTHAKAAITGPYADLFRRGVRRALDSDYCKQQRCLDYSSIFDGIVETAHVVYADYTTPVLDASVDLKDVIFADMCHLLDAGNAIVARKLVADLKLEGEP